MHLKQKIIDNAGELRRLHRRIHETFPFREQGPEKHREWEQACKAFHSSYDKLAFPGGYDGAPERIAAGDPEAMEAAICFLECRPYFFRSGYMFKTILRKAKRAPLSKSQAARLQTVVEKIDEWRESKKKAGSPSKSP
jgi:hypothetical protein